MGYTDKQIKFIVDLKSKSDLTYIEIAEEFERMFGVRKTEKAIELTWRRYKFDCRFDSEDDAADVLIKNLKATHTARKNGSKLKKENAVLIEYNVTLEEFLDQFSKILKDAKVIKPIVAKKPKSKNKTKMIVEAMITDVHFGLKTKSYDSDIARKRLRFNTTCVLREIARKEKTYNIEKIHIPILGDLIQSDSMHGKESAVSCNLTNPEQLTVAVESLFYDVIIPIAQTGYTVDVTGICGNHDRVEAKQHTVKPGKSYFTYTIYRMLEMLCKQSGLKNVVFDIPESVFFVKSIFKSKFLYLHGHTVKANNTKGLEDELIKRQAQVGEILCGIRMGHYHGEMNSNMGRHVISASPVSDDHYGNYLGYKSRPGMTMNFYVDCDRESSFFHSFTIDLAEIK